MEHKGTVLIETERLTLRRFVREDARPAFANWTNDGRVTEFLRWQVGEWTESYRDEEFYHWAIVPKDLGEPVGTITAIGVDNAAEAVRIGYCIGSGWWNERGVGQGDGKVRSRVRARPERRGQEQQRHCGRLRARALGGELFRALRSTERQRGRESSCGAAKGVKNA